MCFVDWYVGKIAINKISVSFSIYNSHGTFKFTAIENRQDCYHDFAWFNWDWQLTNWIF